MTIRVVINETPIELSFVDSSLGAFVRGFNHYPNKPKKIAKMITTRKTFKALKKFDKKFEITTHGWYQFLNSAYDLHEDTLQNYSKIIKEQFPELRKGLLKLQNEEQEIEGIKRKYGLK